MKHTITLTTITWVNGTAVTETRHFINKSAKVATELALRAVERLHKTKDVLGCVEYWHLKHEFAGKTLWFHARTWYCVEFYETPAAVRTWSDDLGYWYPLQRQARGLAQQYLAA